ncbi:MAG: glycosyltransferase [Nitriliruptoraceae bacterium]
MSARPPLGDNPRIAAILPARDEAATIVDAVSSIQRQTRAVDAIVIAAADPETRAAASSLAAGDPRIQVIDNPHGGTSAGLNAAAAAVDADVLVRVDGHAVLPADYVETALDVLTDTGAANVGGRQVPAADNGFAHAVAVAMRTPIGSGNAMYRAGTSAGPADTVYLGVYRRDAFDDVGGFDVAFVRNQDAELNARLRAAGDTVWFDPRLAVTYRPRDTIAGLAAQYFGYGRWRRATVGRHLASLRLRQIAAPLLVAGLLVAVVTSVALGTPWPVVVVAGGYGCAMVVAGLGIAHRPIVGLQVAAALATMHLTWGFGFLVGPPRRAWRAATVPRPPSD